jgi:small-conductance mechanosensitive channel
VLRFAILLLCALATSAAAQDSTPTPAPLSDKAPVVLDGRVLLEVGESGTWSPQQRAKEINRILRAAAADPEPVNLVLSEYEGYPTIRMGEWHLLTVTDSDVLLGMDSAEQAQRWLQVVEAALLEAREQRTAAAVTAAWLRVLAALVTAALLTWVFGRISGRLPVWLARRRRGHAPLPLDHKPTWQLVLEVACVALQITTWIAALLYAVEQFPGARQHRYEIAALVGGSLGAPLFSMNERTYSALDILSLLGAVLALWVAVSLVTRIISIRLVRATGASRGALQPMATLLKYALIFVGLIVILQGAGLNLSSLAIFASVLGVGIGFGLQSIANNFVSGLIISFERPIKPGDFVSIGTLQGTVQRIGARSTVIRTLDRVSIIVPNSRLLENEVVNWSYGDDLARLHLPIAVNPGADLQGVRGALLDAAKSHPAVLADPHPDVRFTGFAGNALNFDLLVWTNNPSGQGALQSDLYYRIEANLRRAGLADPFPRQTIHLSADEVAAAVAPRDDARTPARRELPGSSSATTDDAAVTAPPPVHPGGAAVPSARGLDIESLIADMRGPDGLAIEDRRHLLSVYPKCFVGSEAVAWLMRVHDLTRQEAIHLGQSLVQRGVFHHVLDEHPFRDGNFYYRFYADEHRDGVPP